MSARTRSGRGGRGATTLLVCVVGVGAGVIATACEASRAPESERSYPSPPTGGPLAVLTAGARQLPAARSALGVEIAPRADFSAHLPLRSDAPLRLHAVRTLQPETNAVLDATVRTLDLRATDCAVSVDRVTCRDAAEDLDVAYLHRGDYAEELRVLRSPAAPKTARYRITAGAGAQVRVREGRIEIVVAGVAVLATAKTFALDVRGERRDLQLALEGGAGEGAGAVVIARLDDTGLTYPIVVDPAWSTGASLGTARGQHAAVRLSSGKVLVAGGRNAPGGSVMLSSAELYDPASNTWKSVAPMPSAGIRMLAAPLKGDKALVAFGTLGGEYVYDLATDKWTNAAPGGELGSILGLADGRALTAGGFGLGPSDAASIYDVTTDAWTALPAMQVTRSRPTMIQVSASKVLVFAGSVPTVGGARTDAELLDLGTRTWSSVGKSANPLVEPVVSQLPSGAVLVTGGQVLDASGGSVGNNAGEIFDPAAGKFSPAPTATGFYPQFSFATARGALVLGGNFAAYVEADKRWAVGATPPTIYPETITALGPDRLLGTGLVEASGVYGTATTLLALSPGGTTCTEDVQCASSACTEGVCCDRTCRGACEACAKTGVCGPYSGPIAAGHDPTSCGAYAACTSGACTTTCATDAGCSAGYHCVGNVCTTDGELGSPCTKASECKAGACADGVCCSSACTGPCEACNVAGKAGSCVAVAGAPRAGHPTCGDGSTCGERCDGADRAACHPAPAGAACSGDACKADVETHASTCDGAGRCSDVPKPCNQYVCGATSCKKSCADATDCKNGFLCDPSGTCREPDSTCSADGTQEIDIKGGVADCAPYRCAAGKCATTCKETTECAAGATCDGTHCTQLSAGADAGGCATSRAGAETGRLGLGAIGLSVLALLALVTRSARTRSGRRRRARRPLAALLGASLLSMSGCSSSESAPAGGDDASLGDAAGDTADAADAAPTDGQLDAGDASDAGSPGEAACAKYASAYCQRLDACTNGAVVATRYRNLDGCRTRHVEACLAKLAAPGTTMKPAEVAACAPLTAAVGCNALDYEGYNFVGACTLAKGTLGDGAGCFAHEQCASGHCFSSRLVSCGVCAPAPAPTDSVTCELGRCPRGRVCNTLQDFGGSPCVAPSAPGGDCAAGCSRDDYCLAGKCAPREVKDSPCDPAVDGCALGLRCGATTKVCEAMKVAKIGDPCVDAFLCTGGVYCTGTPMACVPSPRDGESCNGYPPCVAPALCYGGKCVLTAACASGGDAGVDASGADASGGG